MAQTPQYPHNASPSDAVMVQVTDPGNTSSGTQPLGTTEYSTIADLKTVFGGGGGAVSTVNGVAPVDGNVTLTAADVGADASGAAAAVSAASYPDQVPALVHGLTAASPLVPLLAAIANRDAARVDIAVIGDSITEGQGATAFDLACNAQANRAIRSRYPTKANGSGGGLGFIPLAATGESTFTWPVSLASGTANMYLDFGPVRLAPDFATTDAVWTFTAPAGTTGVRICYFDTDGGGGFTWQVDAGAVTTVNNGGTLADIATAVIPLTAGQVLKVSAIAAGSPLVTGIIHYAGDESSGVTLHECGHFGYCAGTESNGWNAPESVGHNWAQCYGNLFPDLAAIAISLGSNDADKTNGNRTAAQFQADLEGLIATLRAAGSPHMATVPVLIIPQYPQAVAWADPGGWPAYVAAMRNVAATDGNAAVIADLTYRMPADTGAASPYYYDGAHPSDLGHALIGEIVAAGVRIA